MKPLPKTEKHIRYI